MIASSPMNRLLRILAAYARLDMIAGIAVRALAAVCVAVLLEIVISLTVSSGLSDLILRDVGVLGLAVCLTAATRQRLVLSR